MTRTATRRRDDPKLAEALDFVAGLVLESGRRWGEVAVDFQWRTARAVLAPDSSTPYAFVTRSRGGSKTLDLAGMILAAMVTQLAPASRCFWLAADRDQGRLAVDAIAGLVSRTPGLSAAFAIESYRVTYRPTGSTMEVLAADAPSSWGITPAIIGVDEIGWWADSTSARAMWESVSSSAAKVKGCRVAVITTPSDPTHWSYAILEHARSDPMWSVDEVRGAAPWIDTAKLDEQRRRLSESMWLRLFEGEWAAAEDRLVRQEDLRECAVLDGPLEPRPGLHYVLGFDMGLVDDLAAGAIMHRERDGRVVLDRLRTWKGSKGAPVSFQAVEDFVLEARAQYRVEVVLDPWQLEDLARRLRERGVRVTKHTFSAASNGRLATTLHLLIREHRIELPADDADLLDELAAIRLTESTPGVPRMTVDPGKKKDRATAIGLAAMRLLERSTRTSRVTSLNLGGLTRPSAWGDGASTGVLIRGPGDPHGGQWERRG